MVKLNIEQRDNLLIEVSQNVARVDERSESIIRELHDQNEHLTRINGTLQNHAKCITSLNTTIYGKDSDEGLCKKVENNKKLLIKLIIAVATISGATGSGVTKLLDIFG